LASGLRGAHKFANGSQPQAVYTVPGFAVTAARAPAPPPPSLHHEDTRHTQTHANPVSARQPIPPISRCHCARVTATLISFTRTAWGAGALPRCPFAVAFPGLL
jgi:hypothetical protein